MKKKYIILADSSNNPTIKYLDPNRFTIVNNSDISTDITTIVNNNVIINSNYDYLIMTGRPLCGQIVKKADRIANRKIIDHRRSNKSDMLVEMVSYNLPVTNTVKFKSTDTLLTACDLMTAMEYLEGDNILLKTELNARGIGQLVLRKENINKTFRELSMLLSSNEEFSKEDLMGIDGVVRVPGEYFPGENFSLIIRNMFNYSGNMLIQQYLEYIKTEYRLLWFLNGDKYVYQRDSEYSSSLPSIFIESDDRYKELYENINKLGLDSGAFALSFDIYEQEDGSLGLFEYSTEFATDKCSDFMAIRESFNDSLRVMISNRERES